MNVVSIMAHQDDEMRCLGTLLKCRTRGDRLFFITLTDGAHGMVQSPDMPRKEAAQIRFQELLSLARSIGAEYVCLGEEDEFLYDTPEIRMRLIEALRHTRADLVFTHYHDDYNLDHTNTFQLVRHCAIHSCLPLLKTESLPLKQHPAIFLVEPHGPIPFPASHFVDITPFEDKKIELIKKHVSQEIAMQMALGTGFEKLCRQSDAYWGGKVGCEYAECFIPMPARGAIKPHPVLP